MTSVPTKWNYGGLELGAESPESEKDAEQVNRLTQRCYSSCLAWGSRVRRVAESISVEERPSVKYQIQAERRTIPLREEARSGRRDWLHREDKSNK